MDPSPNDIAARIMASIAALPLNEQADAIHALINGSLRDMPLVNIHAMRKEIADSFPTDIPIVESTLNLIDGHLALREIKAQ